jgi:3-oxoacyl-[acyl-carrier-protein] synthase III
VTFPELYLSKPGVSVPSTRVDNAEIIGRVRERYHGAESDWPALRSAIEHMFALCRTRQRFLDERPEARVADYAVAAVRKCLELNRAALDEVDVVIFGGIARQYFEPATAMEIAAQLGLPRTHAFDVTTACVGHLEAVQTAAAYLALHPGYRTALVCTSELTGDFLSYDIQSVRDLATKFAGLTIGNAAACMLLRRTPWPGGCIRLLGMHSHVAPEHWELCQVPIRGTLVSSSVELMRLRKLIPPVVRRHLEDVGWSVADVDHFVLHQPSEFVLRQILEDLGADPERAVYSHHLYGNTVSASVGVTFQQLLQERDLRPGDKLVLGSAAAGFSVVMASGVWTAPTQAGERSA